MTEPNLHPALAATVDTADPKAIRDAQLAASRREKDTREVIAQVLAAPHGRNWVWDLLSSCNMFEQSFRPGHPDATAFNEGRRSVGLELTALIMRTDPQAYVQLLKEQGKAS